MSKKFFTRQLRTLLFASLLSFGCGGGKDASSSSSAAFTDTRDSREYRSVKIGGKRWMAQNLNYQTESGSWCYGDNADNCDKYGRLYDWEAAKTACPKGWRLPSREDWSELVTAAGSESGGKKLKSASGWNDGGNGTDDYGFSALPGGCRTDADFGFPGVHGVWWTSTENGNGFAYYRFMSNYEDAVSENFIEKVEGHSVRCVSD